MVFSAGQQVPSNLVPAGSSNLIPNFRKWTIPSPLYVWYDSPWAENKATATIPDGSNYVAMSSPAITLYSGWQYVIQFEAFLSGGTSRVLHVDLYPDDLPESTFTITTERQRFTAVWTSTSGSLASCILRFFAEAQAGGIYIFNVKLEAGAVATPWTESIIDRVGVDNPITESNVDVYMASAAITTAYIKDGNITTAKIGDAQITNAKISSVSADKLTAGTIDASNITVTNLNATNITAGTLNGQRVGSGVDGSVINSNSINASKIVAGSITATQIAAGAITATQIASGTITATQVAAGTFVSTGSAASDINNNTTTINGGKITTGTLTASQIQAGTISADRLVIGGITTDRIGANQVTKMAGGQVYWTSPNSYYNGYAGASSYGYFSTDGGDMFITITVTISGSGDGYGGSEFWLEVNGSDRDYKQAIVHQTYSIFQSSVTLQAYLSSIGTGTQNFRLRWSFWNSGTFWYSWQALNGKR